LTCVETAVADLLPLQLGQADMLFLIVVGIVFAGIVIAVVVYVIRRATTVDDELSEEASVKFEAITPTTTPKDEVSNEERQHGPPVIRGRIRNLPPQHSSEDRTLQSQNSSVTDRVEGYALVADMSLEFKTATVRHVASNCKRLLWPQRALRL